MGSRVQIQGGRSGEGRQPFSVGAWLAYVVSLGLLLFMVAREAGWLPEGPERAPRRGSVEELLTGAAKNYRSPAEMRRAAGLED